MGIIDLRPLTPNTLAHPPLFVSNTSYHHSKNRQPVTPSESYLLHDPQQRRNPRPLAQPNPVAYFPTTDGTMLIRALRC